MTTILTGSDGWTDRTPRSIQLLFPWMLNPKIRTSPRTAMAAR